MSLKPPTENIWTSTFLKTLLQSVQFYLFMSERTPGTPFSMSTPWVPVPLVGKQECNWSFLRDERTRVCGLFWQRLIEKFEHLSTNPMVSALNSHALVCTDAVSLGKTLHPACLCRCGERLVVVQLANDTDSQAQDSLGTAVALFSSVKCEWMDDRSVVLWEARQACKAQCQPILKDWWMLTGFSIVQ